MQSQRGRLSIRQLFITGAVLILGGGAFSLSRSTPKREVAPPEAAPKPKTITALGYLKPRDEVVR